MTEAKGSFPRAVTAVLLPGLVAGAAVVYKFEQKPVDDQATSPALAPFVVSNPSDNAAAGPFLDKHTNNSKAFQTYLHDAHSSGHAFALLKPNQADIQAIENEFSNDQGLPDEPVPTIKEVALFDDADVFGRTEREATNEAPFVLYNQSDRSLDVNFMRFTFKGIKAWLDSERGKQIYLSGEMATRVKQHHIPHFMYISPKVPKSASNIPNDGVTQWDVDLRQTVSFISAKTTDYHGKVSPGHRYSYFSDSVQMERHAVLAVESCQSIVQAYDEHLLPGGKNSAAQLNEYNAGAPTLTPDKTKTLDAQESVCNGLGDIITATYLAGEEGADFLAETNIPFNVSAGPVNEQVDMHIFKPFIRRLVQLKKSVISKPVLVNSGGKKPSITGEYIGN